MDAFTRRVILYGSLLLFLFVLPCTGILCFTCHSNQDSECGDDFKIQRSQSQFIFECQGTCVKRRGKRRSGQVERVEISRECIDFRSDGCFDQVHNNLDTYACACNSNFCNSSVTLSYTFLILLLSLCLTFLCKS